MAATAEDEARWVASEITALHKAGRRWHDVAVMYRSNLQAKLLEDELRQASVPYVMYGGQQFFERKEVKDVIAYLRVALNSRDELALRRVINYPARGIGTTTVERLVTAAHTRNASLWDALRGAIAGTLALPGVAAQLPHDDADPAPRDVDVGDLRGAARNGILELVHVVSELGAAIEGGSEVVTATRTLIEEIGRASCRERVSLTV